MLSSPAKRRKSNSSSAIPVGASDTDQEPVRHDGASQFQKRASFQSPTKASLARSHPQVLSRVLSRSPPKQPKPRPARQSVQRSSISATDRSVLGLQSQKPSRPSSSGAVEIRLRPSDHDARTVVSPRRGGSAPVEAFAAPPRRQSHRLRASQSADSDEGQPKAGSPPNGFANSPEEQLASELGSAANAHETNGIQHRPLSSGLQDEDEPALPPTPTELGLERAPGRPKGLLSSSPSWRQEKRRKRRLRDGHKSSPLKPKNTKAHDDRARDVSPSVQARSKQEHVPEDIREKQKLRDDLATQLARLKEDLARLEDESRRYEKPDDHPPPDEDSVKNLIDLLTTSNPSCAPIEPAPEPPRISSLLSFLLPFSSSRHIPKPKPARPPSPPVKNPFALEQPSDVAPHLTLFAPLSLSVHSTTWSNRINLSQSSSFSQVQHFILSAPTPFPSRVFQVPITLSTDPEKQSVLSIKIPPEPTAPTDKDGAPSIPSTLYSWMTARLSNPLFGHDISGLCWGVNRYWEAVVSRAKVWVDLEKLLSTVRDSKVSQTRKSQPPETENKYDSRCLVPHLDRTSLLFSSSPGKGSSSPQLLVTCQLELDLWTSEPELRPDISVSVPLSNGSKIEQEARKIFTSMLKGGGTGMGMNGDIDSDANLLVRAVHGVVGVVFGD